LVRTGGFYFDGYGNARVLEYTSKGERVRQWGSKGEDRTIQSAAWIAG
jgi:hypothetical protein